MPRGVPGCRGDPKVVRQVDIPVEELEAHAQLLDPLGDLVTLAEDPLVLRTLHQQRRVRERRVLPAVVEMQMGVDDHGHVDWRKSVLGQRVGNRAIHDLVRAEQLIRTTTAGVDEDDAERVMKDHVTVYRPLMCGDDEMAKVETLDLHVLLLGDAIAQSGRRPHIRIRLNG